MRTNYLQRNKKKPVLLKRAGILLIIFGIGAIFFTYSSGILLAIASPVWKGQNAISENLANTWLWFQSKDDLIRKNEILEEKLASREAELVSLRVSAERESELLSMLGREEASNAILASVLVRPPLTPYDVLVVDAGSLDGVAVGQKVSMPEGPVLGVIAETSENTSRVKLFSASGEKTSAVLERHAVPVILVGQGGGSFALNLPRDVEVAEGDKILSADVSSRLLAIVGGVEISPTDSFKKVLVKGAASLFSLRYVLITP